MRVICKDVGGSFGIKVHVYPDEFATVALSMLLRRPVKFVADRLESFVSDIHAREHRVKGRMALTADGEILRVRDRRPDRHRPLFGVSAHQRHRGQPGGQPDRRAVPAPALPCARCAWCSRTRTSMCQYRGVGHPIACAVTEGLVDLAPREARHGPAELRRRNVIPDDAYPLHGAAGHQVRAPVASACLDKLLEMMDYEALRAEQAALRERGVYRGIGLPRFDRADQPERRLLRRRRRAHLGAGRRHGAARCRAARSSCMIGVTEQGQGTEAIIAQIAADARRRADGAGPGDHRRHRRHALWRRHLGVARRRHRRRGGAAGRPWRCARNILDGGRRACCRRRPTSSTSATARSSIADNGSERMPLEELARIAYFRPDTLPRRFQPELMVDAPLRAARLSLRLHQRRAGVAMSRSTSKPASSSC